MPDLGPAITFRGPISRPNHAPAWHGLYALPGDTKWRTVTDGTQPIAFDTARDAEAMAGHVLCAKLRQRPAEIPEPLRTQVHQLMNDLMDWQTMMGGFEAPLWGRVHKMRERVAERPERRLVRAGR